jgi:hypothetical protein
VADGFSVDRAALAEPARGINGVISALEPPGIDEAAGQWWSAAAGQTQQAGQRAADPVAGLGPPGAVL